MLAEEALFIGHPVAHVVAFYDRKREQRIQTQMNAMARNHRRGRRWGD